MGYLGATLTQVFTCVHADMSLRDVTIAQMGNGAKECGWHHALEACGGFWGFWKSQLVELRTRHEKDWLSGFAEARRICALRVPYEMGGRWKSQNRKNVYLSPYVKEHLNSKVIKSFIPELRSRKCFCVLGFLCSMLCIYVMNILCTFHIFMCGYVTLRTTLIRHNVGY